MSLINAIIYRPVTFKALKWIFNRKFVLSRSRIFLFAPLPITQDPCLKASHVVSPSSFLLLPLNR